MDVGEVPPQPKELLDALNEPCPIAKNGAKMIDNHVILWMPPTLNGEPITVDNLEKMAKSDAFGANKIGSFSCPPYIRTDPVINQSLERGFWLVLYWKPVAGWMFFVDKKQYLRDNCKGYERAKTRETIASCMMRYGCSGDKKERILSSKNGVYHSTHEEIVQRLHVVLVSSNGGSKFTPALLTTTTALAFVLCGGSFRLVVSSSYASTFQGSFRGRLHFSN